VNRFEGFDISHTQGEATKASCVVFDHEGPRKDLYRRYNIQSTTDGDDYQAMAEVIQRRYSKLDNMSEWPWLIVIDGGKGQLGQAARVLKSIADNQQIPEVVLLGVAKGSTRKAGFETLFRITSLNQWFQSEEDEPVSFIEQLQKPDDDSVLHLLQEIRDESHRFAIIGHRKARDKTRTHSSLEDIPGVGPKRRSALLKYFGGLQGVKRASIDDLTKVVGIQRSLAEIIYNSLRGEDVS
jgi:excinuclease ABC subunit C